MIERLSDKTKQEIKNDAKEMHITFSDQCCDEIGVEARKLFIYASKEGAISRQKIRDIADRIDDLATAGLAH